MPFADFILYPKYDKIQNAPVGTGIPIIMKLKVCGMRDVENIQALIELKPDFIGFIFYDKSPRFIGNDADVDFINSIPREIKKVGVFVDATIDFILQNVKYKFYGKDSLCPTGPGLLGRFFTTNQKKQMELYFENCGSIYYICYNNIIILKMYDEYRVEQSKYQKNHYYANLWNQKQIYK